MGGIVNYFHGESAKVAACWWELAGRSPAYVMALEGDPHRSFARDYGSDIGIDPLIEPGDQVSYLRLDDTTGIWLRSAHQAPDGISQGVERVLEHRRWILRWRSATSDADHVDIAREIYEATGDPLRITSTQAGATGRMLLSEGWALLDIVYDGLPDDRPRSAASLFLSHASEDTLLGRRIHQDLSHDANADVWFDLAQPAQDVPKTDAAIEAWLGRSVHDANGLVLLWTEHAAKSEWVRKEFAWARELLQTRPGFRLIVLVLRDVPLPVELRDSAAVIDCRNIWWSNGLNEELYAAVLGRQSRRAWLETLPPGAPVYPGRTIGYEDFESHAGTVTSFHWSLDQTSPARSLRWVLEYRTRDGAVRHDSGSDRDHIADLEMKPGDRVGFFKVRWRHGAHVLEGPDLWMRSADLAITSDTVLDHYFATLIGPAAAEQGATAGP